MQKKKRRKQYGEKNPDFVDGTGKRVSPRVRVWGKKKYRGSKLVRIGWMEE
jgi:hypothetical protein